MVLERDFQAKFIRRLKKEFPGCWVLKQDSSYQQGIPDWVVFYGNQWAMFEIKRKRPTSESDFEPNQEWFIETFDDMSFAACVYPENMEEVIDELQRSFAPRGQTRVSRR